MAKWMAYTALAKKLALGGAGALAGVGGAVAWKLDQEVRADLTLHPPSLPWSHGGMIDSLDHASVRRGYQVWWCAPWGCS